MDDHTTENKYIDIDTVPITMTASYCPVWHTKQPSTFKNNNILAQISLKYEEPFIITKSSTNEQKM